MQGGVCSYTGTGRGRGAVVPAAPNIGGGGAKGCCGAMGRGGGTATSSLRQDNDLIRRVHSATILSYAALWSFVVMAAVR